MKIAKKIQQEAEINAKFNLDQSEVDEVCPNLLEPNFENSPSKEHFRGESLDEEAPQSLHSKRSIENQRFDLSIRSSFQMKYSPKSISSSESQKQSNKQTQEEKLVYLYSTIKMQKKSLTFYEQKSKDL